MTGPCMCGDPYCGRCGSPEAAKLEAAEEWAMTRLGQAGLTPEEYRVVVSVGLAAVHQARTAAALALADYKIVEAEARACAGSAEEVEG